MHPYKSLSSKAFWGNTFSKMSFTDIDSWHQPQFDISNMRIASAGSCFAQHIGKALKNKGFKYIDAEPAPDFLPQSNWQDYGYGIYSGRYGNVYTVRQMLQLAQRAFGVYTPKESAWEHRGGVVDPFRPTLEPEPFGSVGELETCRRSHLLNVAELLSSTDLLIFTLGLTETYASNKDGSVFPVCPGVSGGEYSDDNYQFLNLNYSENMSDFNKLKSLLHKVNPKLRYLLTVSPVPLIATATDKNVGVATTYSKSVLRAVAGALSDNMGRVDYFPSYEIITMPAGEGMFYEKDKRGVTSEGVAHVMANVMKSFNSSQDTLVKANDTVVQLNAVANSEELVKHNDEEDIVCDEELLAQFGNR